jgi:hypothetical protein
MNDKQRSYDDPDIETIMMTYKVLNCRLKELQSRSSLVSNRRGTIAINLDYFSYLDQGDVFKSYHA